MAVLIGSARSDERGKATGGKAGDQNGREVSTQNWYRHQKGWRVLRAKNPLVAKYMAEAMRDACANNKIGYDQNQNKDLWNISKKYGYDPEKVTTATETDCARLVRVCVQYACIKSGIDVIIPDFYTATLARELLSTGLFDELKGSKYTTQSTYLGVGDCLVTCSKGHTVIVLSNGSKYEGAVSKKEYVLGVDVLNTDTPKCDAVATMQQYLIDLGYDLGKYGADGDFGDCTEIAVIKFQRDYGCDADGEYGPITHEAMLHALETLDGAVTGKIVRIEGGQCWIRTEPNTTSNKLEVAKRGSEWAFDNEIADNGWLAIKYNDKKAWVSNTYGTLVG